MPRVDIHATVPDCDPDELFVHVERFEAYVDIAPNVLAVSVERPSDNLAYSKWEVSFRSGILKWTEEDRIDHSARTILFDQSEGDLEVFRGEWNVTDSDGAVRIHFGTEYDLGIPSLAAMLNPAATRTVQKNARELIEAFARSAGAPRVEYDDEEPAEPARAVS
jgi:ribosome-associated toxin RatA of RatAB toxin-antitoxin module